MTKERRNFLRIAPHLVHPLPCLTPTYRELRQNKFTLSIALAVSDLIGIDRNRNSDPEKFLPRGRLISREACLRLLPEIDSKNITGGAIWYDGQMYNSERLTLSFVISAVQQGAVAANYVEAVAITRSGDRVTGVQAIDRSTGTPIEVRARIVINSAGPWVDRILGQLKGITRKRLFRHSVAINLVTRRILEHYAVGIQSDRRYKNGVPVSEGKPQLLFVAPWREHSIIGTFHLPMEQEHTRFELSESKLNDLLGEINNALPGARLKPADVHMIHTGFLPAEGGGGGRVQLVREGRVYDHQREDGVEGLITVLGVKYTAARLVAEKTVDLAFQKLGRQVRACLTADTPIYGGDIKRFDDFLEKARSEYEHRIEEETLRRLVYNYGSAFKQVTRFVDRDLRWGERICGSSPAIKAEVLNAIENEMALKLSDVIFRRTEIGTAGKPEQGCLETCAHLMAEASGWDENKRQQELLEVINNYGIITP